MFFKDIYKPIPLIYNLVLAMLWRHPENDQHRMDKNDRGLSDSFRPSS